MRFSSEFADKHNNNFYSPSVLTTLLLENIVDNESHMKHIFSKSESRPTLLVPKNWVNSYDHCVH